MQKVIFILTFILLTTGCSQKEKKISDNKESSQVISADTHSNTKTIWYDELLTDCIRKSDNVLIKSSRQDTAIRIEWLLDRVENADTAKFFIFHVGHDVADENNTNPRFVTDGWIYIDSLTKTLYEYDLPNDSLIKWKK
jgi:hypothetical protein